MPERWVGDQPVRAAGDAETWAIVGKRLVFVMCDVVDGKPTHMNYVIYATLAA